MRGTGFILRAARAAMATGCMVFSAASCQYKELCYTHPHEGELEIKVDWSESRYSRFDDGRPPTGMTLAVYRKDSDAKPTFISTNDTDGIRLRLPEGTYDMLLFNQSFIEFGSLQFMNTESYGDIYAGSVESKVAWYAKASPEELVTRTPEWIAAARVEDLAVGSGMARMPQTREAGTAELGERTLVLRPHTPVKKARLLVFIEGYQNLASIRAVIGGFAQGWYMGRDLNSAEGTSYLLGGWEAERDSEDATRGTAHSDFQLFGLTDGFKARPEDITVHLECLLTDGKTVKTFDFRVGDQVQELHADVDVDVDVDIDIDINIELNITLPDVGPEIDEQHKGGFSIDVEDWDEEIITNIPLT